MSYEQVAKALAQYKDLLLFERGLHPDKGEVTLVRSKQFMGGKEGRTTWIAINSTVKALGGKWIPLGKESHWMVPTKASKPTESFMSFKCPHCDKTIKATIGGT